MIYILSWTTEKHKKLFPGHYIQSWRKFKDFSRKNGIQGFPLKFKDFSRLANPEYERQRRRTKASLSHTSNLVLVLNPNPHFWIFNSVSVGPTHLLPLRFEYLFTLRLRVAETCLICDDPLQLEEDVKEPVTLFEMNTLYEMSRGRRPRCHGLSDLCRHRSGWARCDQHMDWRGCEGAPLHADVRSHLSCSSAIQQLAASEESWHRLFF